VLFRGAETHARSVLKAVSWRTLGTLGTFAISWFMTGTVVIAGSFACIEVVTKIAWYARARLGRHSMAAAQVSWLSAPARTETTPASQAAPDLG